MIPRTKPEVNCLGKDQLETASLAKTIARRMSSRHDAVIRPYKCEHCGFYHVGEIINHGKIRNKKTGTRR